MRFGLVVVGWVGLFLLGGLIALGQKSQDDRVQIKDGGKTIKVDSRKYGQRPTSNNSGGATNSSSTSSSSSSSSSSSGGHYAGTTRSSGTSSAGGAVTSNAGDVTAEGDAALAAEHFREATMLYYRAERLAPNDKDIEGKYLLATALHELQIGFFSNAIYGMREAMNTYGHLDSTTQRWYARLLEQDRCERAKTCEITRGGEYDCPRRAGEICSVIMVLDSQTGLTRMRLDGGAAHGVDTDGQPNNSAPTTILELCKVNGVYQKCDK